ncbi:MAG: hypothetical protein U0414_41640 [Polyangiaceae bacterium]
MRLRLLFASGLLLAAGGLLAASGCKGGKVLYNVTDPKQCATGHGCPMAVCACADKSFMIDSTCELGECLDADAVCADRCEDFGGVLSTVATKDDDAAIPACGVLDQRMYVNGCKIGVDLLASTCEEDGLDCGLVASDFWGCVVGRGILACKRGALRVEGCADFTPDLCTDPTP